MYVNLAGTAGDDNFSLDFSNLDPFGSINDNLYIINGGAGIDTVNFSHLSSDFGLMTIVYGGNHNPGEQYWSFIYKSDVDGKRITFEIHSVERFIGSAGNDGIEGDGNTTVPTTMSGMGGDDYLIGSQGPDQINGGIGNDALAGYGGNDRLVGDAGNDLIGGEAGNDSIDAGAGDDTVRGDAGDDNIYGGAGDDILSGDDGNDILDGAGGADTLSGGYNGGTDTVVYAGSTAGVIVNLALGRGYAGDAAGDKLSGIEQIIGSAHADQLAGDVLDEGLWGGAGDDRLFGAAGADTLRGGTGADTLQGGAGRDILMGEDGNDVLDGGAGGDRLDGGAGIDTVTYASATAGVIIGLYIGQGTGGEAAGDTYSGIEGVIGSAYADKITGDLLSENIWGGAGNDVLNGWVGADNLRGGSGADRFIYEYWFDSTVEGDGRDVIVDFSAAEGDRIDLSYIAPLGIFTLGTGAFTGRGPELRVVAAGGYQVVYGDIDGDRRPDFAISVIADHALRASDFML
jgi:Ca2+-binding RTX toxin-like protein